MKRKTILFSVAMVLSASVIADTSIGVIAGEPTGLSLRQQLGGLASLDVALAWSFVENGSIYAHLDYQQYFQELDITRGQLLFFVGIGGKAYISELPGFGIRIPLGVFYNFPEVPLEAFLEIAPGMLLFPETSFDGMGGIGLRYQLGRGGF